METGTIVMAMLVTAFFCSMCELAYNLGKQKGQQECALDVERADRYMMAVDDLDRWCGNESPQARLIAAHLFSAGEGLKMNAGTPCGDEPCTISGLREQLRRLAPVEFEEGK